MSEIKLKSCPFCGGKPYLETNHRAFINAKTTKVAYVWCRSCNARTERIPLEKYGKTSHSLEAESDAMKAWNNRVEKTGRWINISSLLTAARCSECKSAFAEKTNFCPYCGAKMESEVTSDD